MRVFNKLSLGICGFLIAQNPAIALAAKDSHGQASGGDTGLPQFDPSSYPSQIFWLAVTFVVLYVFFSKKTLPEISSVIENRQEHIQSDIDTAEKLRKEAEEVQQFYEESLENARLEASKSYAEAEEAVKEKTAKKYESFRKKSAKQIGEMEERLETEKAKVMEEMNTIAAEIASQAAEKIVGIPADIDQAKTVVRSLHKTTKKAA